MEANMDFKQANFIPDVIIKVGLLQLSNHNMIKSLEDMQINHGIIMMIGFKDKENHSFFLWLKKQSLIVYNKSMK